MTASASVSLIELLGLALALGGGLIAVFAAIGFIRMPDHYLRGHCISAITLVGAPALIGALILGALDAGEGAVAGRLALLLIAAFAMAPILAHINAAAAHAAKVTPSLDLGRKPGRGGGP